MHHRPGFALIPLMFKAFPGIGISVSLFVVGALSMTSTKRVPLPPAATPTTVDLGKALFNDTTLSSPAGMSCGTCHSPSAGFTYPESDVNLNMGPVEGVMPGRFGNRRPPSISYAAYLPTGIPQYVPSLQAYVGGLFWDGRAANTTAQAEAPFVNPNEMNNLLHNLGDPASVVLKVKNGPSGDMFRAVYGQAAFSQSTTVVYGLIAKSIAAFEASSQVAPFSSKYDAWLAGKATLTADEMQGLRLVTGRLNGRPNGLPNKYNAHCSECHGIIANPSIGPDLWTNSCYANIGVPKNPQNPYYTMTNATINPVGYNPLGAKYVDLGLGDYLYPHLGLPSGDLAQGDPLAIDGTFKTPTLRNVDLRPNAGFVKSYMHNGVFKSLKQVVHFYNTRNLTTYPGEIIDFTKPNPYAHLRGKPLWPPPEWPSPVSMINPQGALNVAEQGVMNNEQIGNMGMSDLEENEIVAFLKTLSDGYFVPN